MVVDVVHIKVRQRVQVVDLFAQALLGVRVPAELVQEPRDGVGRGLVLRPTPRPQPASSPAASSGTSMGTVGRHKVKVLCFLTPATTRVTSSSLISCGVRLLCLNSASMCSFLDPSDGGADPTFLIASSNTVRPARRERIASADEGAEAGGRADEGVEAGGRADEGAEAGVRADEGGVKGGIEG